MSNDNECLICFDTIDIEKQNLYLFKNCQHNKYHTECISNWINSCKSKNIIPTCPICCNEYINQNNNEPIYFIYNQKYYGVYIITISFVCIIIGYLVYK